MMKKILLILLCLPMIGFGQQTYVPDDNFEAWIETTYPAADNGISNDNYVLTAGLVDYQLTLNTNVSPGPIFDLTGIEDFIFNRLILSDLLVTSIDLSMLSNTVNGWGGVLEIRIFNFQFLEEVILPNNNDTLPLFNCYDNASLNSIIFQSSASYNDISITCNENLCELNFKGKMIETGNYQPNIRIWQCPIFKLDFSEIIEAQYQTAINIAAWDQLACANNTITGVPDTTTIYINLDNSVPIYNWIFDVSGWGSDIFYNSIVNVSSNQDANYCTVSNDWNTIESDANYCTNCYTSANCQAATSIQEHTTNKELLKVTDLLGRETKGTKNEILFYIYDDGTVEKRIIIE